MKSVSYCTTCKGRLWQLRQTLPINLQQTSDTCELILLDYHSEDGLERYIKDNYEEYLQDGRLKYYKLVTVLGGFDMAFAKHLSHLLANHEVLFNLDSDNFIGDTLLELRDLSDAELLTSRIIKETKTARFGRIGMTKQTYTQLNGYDISIRGMAGDDSDMIKRALMNGLRLKVSVDESLPIPQSDQIKYQFNTQTPNKLPSTVQVVNHNNEMFTITPT